MKTPIILAALAAATIPVAGRAATPSDAGDTSSMTVQVGDLALGHAAGADAALKRIRYAARVVCGPAPMPFEGGALQRRHACVRKATEGAIRDLDAPLVTARYYHVEPTRLLAAR